MHSFVSINVILPVWMCIVDIIQGHPDGISESLRMLKCKERVGGTLSR